jgi:hypothetical protein
VTLNLKIQLKAQIGYAQQPLVNGAEKRRYNRHPSALVLLLMRLFGDREAAEREQPLKSQFGTQCTTD